MQYTTPRTVHRRCPVAGAESEWPTATVAIASGTPELDTRWLSVSLRGRHGNSDMRLYSPVQCVGFTRPHPPEVRPTTRLVLQYQHTTEPVCIQLPPPRFQKQPLQTRQSRDMLKLQKGCTTMPRISCSAFRNLYSSSRC